MTSDLNIYRAANELIEQHGLKGASDHTADRIAELTERGDRRRVCLAEDTGGVAGFERDQFYG